MAPSSNNLVIIGGGPAALTAALYAARAGLRAQVFERANVGGLLGEISSLDNYPGFEGTGGALADVMRRQAIAAGAEIEYGECGSVRLLTDGDSAKIASLASSAAATSGNFARESSSASSHAAHQLAFELMIDNVAVRAGAVLIATGAAPKPLPFAVTPPVSYCALCDGALAKGQDVVVVGGANAAVQESLFLAKLARSVTIITHSKLKADAILQKQLTTVSNITVIEDREPTPEFLGQFAYVFVFIGHRPATDFLRDLSSSYPLLDPQGYILTNATASSNRKDARHDAKMGSSAFGQQVQLSHMTAIPGLFAAGDVRSGSLRQVVTAAGDGASAAVEISAWLNR